MMDGKEPYEAHGDMYADVGELAGELSTFLKMFNLPDPEDVLARPASFKLPEEGDVRFALLQGVTGAVVANLTPPRYEAGWIVLHRFGEVGCADMAAPSVKEFAKLYHDKKNKGLQPPVKYAKHYRDVLGAGGMWDQW
jgi:hypothetical protein